MPFRRNTFGKAIAQPGTDLAEIEQYLIETFGAENTTIWSADLYREDDDQFRFGGILYVTLELFPEDGDIEEGVSFDTQEHRMEFDGFESLDDARDFLASLGSFYINEVK